MPSVLRRYTPPTCTLEISANESPLSRWTDRAVLKHLRFQLSFDDPRLLPEEQVHVTGSRTQLEALHEVVETYVQGMLDSAPVQFNHRLVPSAPEVMRSSPPDGVVAEPDMTPAVLSDREARTNGERFYTANVSAPAAIAPAQNGVVASQNIFLRPKGLLNHELHLGTLATEESGIVVPLSTLQLFDLANALDEYAADAVALPALARPAWMQSRSAWLKVAAAAVVALGVTTTLGKFVMDVSSPEMQTASSPAQNSETTGAPESFNTVPPALDPAKTPPNLTSIPTPIPTGTALPAVPVPGTVPPAGSTVPTRPTNIPPLPQFSPVPQQNPRQNSQPGAIASAPPNSQVQIPTRPSIAQAPPLPAPDAASDSAAARQAAPEGGAALEAPSSQAAAGSRSTAFDTIPQVAELRDYFQQRWTPPDTLNQTLEYRLSVGADGTLQQITPLGQASSTYVDRTGIPLTGEPLVSPLENAQSARIRLVLSPDGRVQTFLEATE